MISLIYSTELMKSRERSHMGKKLKTITTSEEATQVFVARAQHWAESYGYRSSVLNGLCAIGLGDYINTGCDTYQVDLSPVLAKLAEFTVNVDPHEDDDPRTVDFESQVSDLIYEWRQEEMTEAHYTKLPPSDKTIDLDAVLGAYGRDGDLPPVKGDEPHARWRELVTATLAWGEEERHCGTLENALRHMGFRDFLPPLEGVMDITWHGVTIPGVRVNLDRTGRPVRDALYRVMVDKVRSELNEITFTPAVAAE